MVESAVRAVVGEERIAKNVNADEAAVMGTSPSRSPLRWY
jgi:molecular chaperone DnaK (HSP70)